MQDLSAVDEVERLAAQARRQLAELKEANQRCAEILDDALWRLDHPWRSLFYPREVAQRAIADRLSASGITSDYIRAQQLEFRLADANRELLKLRARHDRALSEVQRLRDRSKWE